MDNLCTGEIPCTVSHTGNQKGASIKTWLFLHRTLNAAQKWQPCMGQKSQWGDAGFAIRRWRVRFPYGPRRRSF